jgi:hypothetical protein
MQRAVTVYGFWEVIIVFLRLYVVGLAWKEGLCISRYCCVMHDTAYLHMQRHCVYANPTCHSCCSVQCYDFVV